MEGSGAVVKALASGRSVPLLVARGTPKDRGILPWHVTGLQHDAMLDSVGKAVPQGLPERREVLRHKIPEARHELGEVGNAGSDVNGSHHLVHSELRCYPRGPESRDGRELPYIDRVGVEIHDVKPDMAILDGLFTGHTKQTLGCEPLRRERLHMDNSSIAQTGVGAELEPVASCLPIDKGRDSIVVTLSVGNRNHSPRRRACQEGTRGAKLYSLREELHPGLEPPQVIMLVTERCIRIRTAVEVLCRYALVELVA